MSNCLVALDIQLQGIKSNGANLFTVQIQFTFPYILTYTILPQNISHKTDNFNTRAWAYLVKEQYIKNILYKSGSELLLST
jgi:hypothetical protein